MLVPYDSYSTAQEKWDNGETYSILCCTNCISPTSWVKTVMFNHELISWLAWVNKNICLPLQKDVEKTFNTTEVKLRIATGMLNKIESLTDLEKIQIHMNLTENVQQEKSRLILNSLPF